VAGHSNSGYPLAIVPKIQPVAGTNHLMGDRRT